MGVERGRKVVADCQGAFSVAGSEDVHLSPVEHVDPTLFSAGTDKLERHVRAILGLLDLADCERKPLARFFHGFQIFDDAGQIEDHAIAPAD